MTVELDEQLIAEALGGRREAFSQLALRHQKTVYHVAYKIVRNDETAQDIAQETFLKAYTALGSYRSEFRFTTWLCKIAANTAIDHLRKIRIQELSFDRPSESGDGFEEYEVADWSNDPEKEFADKQRRITIDVAIDDLPPHYRDVIIYRHKDDKSYEEIAELLKVPVGTVKARIFRARELLKKSLREIR